MLTERRRSTGLYATYRGKEYPVVTGGVDRDGVDYIGLRLGPDDDATPFDTVEEGVPGRRMAKVPRGDLERYERVTLTGIVDGMRVTMFGLGPIVPCTTLAGDEWAAAHGFTGSQHDGWEGELPLDQITDIHEDVKDLLATTNAGGGR